MQNLPLTVKRSIELLGICAVGMLVVLGKDVVMPLLMALFIALLMLPVFRWLYRHKVPEVLAILLSILLFFIIIAGIGFFLAYEVGALVSDFETLQKNLMVHWQNLSKWISQKLNYSNDQQMAMIHKQGSELGGNISGYVQGAATSLSGILIFIGLLPIYIFLIIFYRKLIHRFINQWFDKEDYPKVKDALEETEVIVKYYLLGLIIQIAYLTILVGGILLLLGIKYAILIGVTFAVLNLIPYLGALLGNLIGVLLTLTSSTETWQIWAVLGTIAFVQFLDNNILMPRIVGSKVKINALASIVGIVLGGTMAGVSGMFLSIPVMAVLKIVFDRSAHLKQWGILLGDARPEDSKNKKGMFKFRQKLESERNEEVDKKM